MKHLFTMLLALIAATASAQDFMVDGICYNILSEDERTVEVTESPYGYAGDVVIPAEVTYDGSIYSVTTIGDEAFYWCDNLTSVSMPSVTTIGNSAFFKCSALTSISMPSVTKIGDYAFNACSALTSVEMPEVTKIGDYAFNACSALTSVEMPEVTKIGNSAFENCSALTSVSMPEAKTIGNSAFSWGSALTSVSMPSVKTIGKNAFGLCRALTSVSMPAVTTIGNSAFSHCSALTSASMPSVTTIGGYAFLNCSALTSVDIPASCTSIGSCLFAGCTALKEIVVDDNNPNYSSADGVLYDKGKTTLLSWPTAEGGINLPLSFTKIGGGAFYNCWNLTSVSMPSVTTIGERAFWSCRNLTSVDIPASVTMIGEGAFTYCDALTSVYCHWEQPLECDPGFTDEALMNATLYVPVGTIDAYGKVDPWRNFWNIEERDYSGIADDTAPEVVIKVIDGAITVEGGDMAVSAPVVEVYSAGGVCVYRGTDTVIGGLTHGVYVVKVGDTVQKVAL